MDTLSQTENAVKFYLAKGVDSLRAGDTANAVNLLNWVIKVAPDNVDALAARAAARMDGNDLPAALSDIDYALSLEWQNAHFHYLRGRIVSGMGDEYTALESFNNAVEMDAGNPMYLLHRAVALGKTGELQQAIDDLNRVIELDPSITEAFRFRGMEHVESGRPRRAIEDLNESLNKGDVHPEICLYERGLAFADIGEFNRSFTDFAEALKVRPDYPDVYIARGKLFLLLDNYQDALSQFAEALHYDHNDWRGHFYTALALSRTGRNRQAMGCLMEAQRLNPQSAEVHCGLGRVSHRLGMLEESLQHYDRTIRLNAIQVDAYLGRALCLKKMNADSEAVHEMMQDLAKAVRLDTQTSLAYFHRNAVPALPSYRPAAAKFAKPSTLHAGPDDEKLYAGPDEAAHLNKGLDFFRQQLYKQAALEFSKAIEANPQDPHAYFFRGEARIMMNMLQPALQDYSDALKLNPQYTNALCSRAFCYERLEQFDQAVRDLDGAIASNPDLAPAYMQTIQSLQERQRRR